MRLSFTRAARNDLKDIATYIAQDAPLRAKSFATELRMKCRNLVENPSSGSPRSEIRHNTGFCLTVAMSFTTRFAPTM